MSSADSPPLSHGAAAGSAMDQSSAVLCSKAQCLTADDGCRAAAAECQADNGGSCVVDEESLSDMRLTSADRYHRPVSDAVNQPASHVQSDAAGLDATHPCSLLSNGCGTTADSRRSDEPSTSVLSPPLTPGDMKSLTVST